MLHTYTPPDSLNSAKLRVWEFDPVTLFSRFTAISPEAGVGVMAFIGSNLFGDNDHTARTAGVLNSHHNAVGDGNSGPAIVPSGADAASAPYDNNSAESDAVSVAEFGSDTDTATHDKEMPTGADTTRMDGGNNLEEERKQGDEIQALARTYTTQSRASGAEPFGRVLTTHTNPNSPLN
ncbi:hypothetical protein V491_00734, partial [Pseudogymnoascus sp. VKM F-3775]